MGSGQSMVNSPPVFSRRTRRQLRHESIEIGASDCWRDTAVTVIVAACRLQLQAGVAAFDRPRVASFGDAALLVAFGGAALLVLLPFGVAFAPLGDLLGVFE